MGHWIWFALTGTVIGWSAGHLVQGKGMGLLTNLVVGILGALVGGFLAEFFHLHVAGFWGSFGVSVLGAVVLLVLIRLIRSS
jgi:uncharacterized membrane protein YeaQ/YmgE (transglycosylase-associated protein family)